MKILSIHPQQKDLRLILKTDTGENIELVKIGKEIACISPPEKLYKQSSRYIALKKVCAHSDYFNSDLHLTVRQKSHMYELKQRLKMFINTEL